MDQGAEPAAGTHVAVINGISRAAMIAGIGDIVPREGCMTEADAALNMEAMWQLTADSNGAQDRSDNSYEVFKVSILKYLMRNGTSSQSIHTAEIQAGTNIVSTHILDVQLGDRVRRWARAYADAAREILYIDHSFRLELAAAAGVSPDFGHLAFDFADYCSKLSKLDRDALKIMKWFKVNSIEPNLRNISTRHNTGQATIQDVDADLH